MSDETKIFTKNDKNGDKCASGGQESGLKLIFERGVAILVRPWRFPGQPKKFVFFSIKVGTINSGTSLDSREQFKKTGKLELIKAHPQFVISLNPARNRQFLMILSLETYIYLHLFVMEKFPNSLVHQRVILKNCLNIIDGSFHLQ